MVKTKSGLYVPLEVIIKIVGNFAYLSDNIKIELSSDFYSDVWLH